MKKILGFLATVLLVVSGAGCSLPGLSGMNMQRMSIRDGADAAVTTGFEVVDDAHIQGTLKGVKEASTAVGTFLDSGKVADLLVPDFIAEIKKLVPADYQCVIDTLVSVLDTKTLDVGKIGVNNVKRLKEACYGMGVACDRYNLAERPVKTETAAAAVPGATAADRGVVNRQVSLQKFNDKVRSTFRRR